jgi:RNA 3'-terminal phosphate cyclase (ATP)
MTDQHITIDGSCGEGGGQIVRSSVLLSVVTGRPLTIHKIRAGRRPTGLKRQHVTAVAAAAEICGASVRGATVGSARLDFEPGRVASGNYEFAIQTAGSTTLVLQTVLPALLMGDGPSSVTLSGGTHNPWAPPFDFLDRVYLPLINRMGPDVHARLDRPGFYPAGGGRFRVEIQPAGQLRGFDLTQRGAVIHRRIRAMVARLPRHIARREIDTVLRKLEWPKSAGSVEEITDSHGPGNVVMIEVECEHVSAMFTGFGQRGVKAEKVAAGAARAARRYLSADVPVDEHVADQILLPLGLAARYGTGGGTLRTLALSNHATTHAEILRRFLDIEIAVDEQGKDEVTVHVG